MKPAFQYSAQVERVVDGDTVDLRVDLGFTVFVQARVRLLGLNAPELSEHEGRKVRQELMAMLPFGIWVVVRTHKAAGDKYGRWLAEIEAGGVNVNQWLLDAGLAKAWDGSGAKPV